MTTPPTSDPSFDAAPVPDAPDHDLRELRRRLDRLHDVDEHDIVGLVADLETAYEELVTADEEVRAQREHIARLVHGQARLRWQQERMLAIIPVAVVATDGLGVIRSVNAAASTLFDMRVARLLGKPLPALFAPSDRLAFRRFIGTSSQAPTSIGEVSLLHPRAGVERVQVTMLPTVGDSARASWLMLPSGQGGGPTAGGLPQALADLATLPSLVDGKADLLRRSAALVAVALGNEVAISVSLGPPAAPTELASTCQVAQAMDGAQLRAGEGPSVTAFMDTFPVVSEDVRHDPRWPRLTAFLPSQVRGVVAVPLEVGQRVVGSLNVYRTTPGPAAALVEAAELAGATLAAGLYELDVRADLRRTATEMETALRSRAVIDQAKGIVMAHRRCTAEEAFAHLVELSSAQGKKVRVVARELVEQAAGRTG